MQHQDWTPIVIGRNKQSSNRSNHSNQPINQRSTNQQFTNQQFINRPSKQIQAALNNDGMPNRIEKIDKKISQNIQNARNALGISRKELAQKINEKETLVAEYENGIAIPSATILNKIDKVLKTKVRGVKGL